MSRSPPRSPATSWLGTVGTSVLARSGLNWAKPEATLTLSAMAAMMAILVMVLAPLVGLSICAHLMVQGCRDCRAPNIEQEHSSVGMKGSFMRAEKRYFTMD